MSAAPVAEPSPAENTRLGQCADFVALHGFDPASLVPLAADASFRRYFRVFAPHRAVIMDAPPDKEPLTPFLTVARHLTGLGFSPPRILAQDSRRGFLLLEDLGDDTFTALLRKDAASETRLYELAIDCLIALHRHPDAAAIALPAYTTALLLEEAALFADWYLPALTGTWLNAEARLAYDAAWAELLGPLAGRPPAMVLRDYHVDNLLLLPGRSGVAACGLLDFQDAVLGPAAYDLFSLIEDARRDVPPDLHQAMLGRYLAAMPDLDAETFIADGALLAAQRHAKVAGIFVRLWLRDGKPDYLRHVPRVVRLLDNHLQRPGLGPLRRWLRRFAPHFDADLPDPDTLRERWQSLAPSRREA